MPVPGAFTGSVKQRESIFRTCYLPISWDTLQILRAPPLVLGGCVISGASVRRSLLFSSVHVHSYARVEDSVVLSNVDVGRNVVLRRAVVEKGCVLPPGVRIGVHPEEDRKWFDISPKGITLVVPEMIKALQDSRAA